MIVEMRYGKEGLKVEVPDENLVEVLRMRRLKPLEAPMEAVIKALLEPIASPPLAELAKGKKNACIVISDITRPVPNKIILPPMLSLLEKSGIPKDKITILIATGIHRPNEGKELEEMVGKEIMERYRIVNHFSRRPETHKFLGLTSGGTPVYVDKTYLESDLKITTSLIEPHLMAGYSGGRKAICPGVCSLETMKVMHGPKILEHENARAGVMDGNPFHKEALEIQRLAGVDFILNVSIDDKRKLIGVFAGHPILAHEAGIEFVENNVKMVLDEPVDIVLTSSSGYPLDSTFYQAIKGPVGVLEVVKPGGAIILVTGCSEGIGGKEFTELILETQDLDEFIKDLYDPSQFVVDQWQLEELAKVLRKSEVYCFSEGITKDDLRRLFVLPLDSPEAGIKKALEKHGQEAKIVAVPEGPYVLPVLKDSQ